MMGFVYLFHHPICTSAAEEEWPFPLAFVSSADTGVHYGVGMGDVVAGAGVTAADVGCGSDAGVDSCRTPQELAPLDKSYH